MNTLTKLVNLLSSDLSMLMPGYRTGITTYIMTSEESIRAST